MLGDFGSGIALTFLSQEFDDFDISLRVSKQRGIKAMKLLPQLPVFLEEKPVDVLCQATAFLHIRQIIRNTAHYHIAL